jgi:hypothetical protein
VSTPLASENAGAEMLRDLISKMLADGTRHAQLRVRYADLKLSCPGCGAK